MGKVIISGATGVIGMALINKCIEENRKMLLILRPASGRNEQIEDHPLIDKVYANLSDYDELAKNMLNDDCDVFYHFAWDKTFGAGRNDKTAQEKNVEYTLSAVRLAKALGCHTFIGAGSQAEYGRVDGVLTEATPLNPENEYGRCKALAAERSRALCKELGMKHIWTRVLSVYGPFDGQQTMISFAIKKLLNGEDVPLTKGEQIWDYIYASDAANAFYLLGDKGQDTKTYLIASGESQKLHEYMEILYNEVCNIVKEKSLKDVNPGRLDIGAIPYSDKQVMRLEADISPLIGDTGFEPRVTFEEGIRRTIIYLRRKE